MSRITGRPKSRTALLAEALEAQRVINRNLAKIDLRSAPQSMREPIKNARLRGGMAADDLAEALQADAQSLAASA